MDLNSIKEKLYNMGNKKLFQNLLIVCLVAAIVVISADTFFSNNKPSRNSIEETDIQFNIQTDSAVTYEEQLEKKLKGILEQISGVGEVSVMVTLNTGREVIPATNTIETSSETNERDGDGGTRTVTQNSVDRKIVLKNNVSVEDQPLIVKEVMPEVKGVIVVAQGAERVEVAARLTEAVQTVLGIPAFRVKVYPK
jgi:stage III sporulation protein AG